MSAPIDERLFEVHIIDDEHDRWTRASGFETLEEARIEALHLIRDTDVHTVRIMHVVEYYEKEPADVS
jgi:hypothetical protein